MQQHSIISGNAVYNIGPEQIRRTQVNCIARGSLYFLLLYCHFFNHDQFSNTEEDTINQLTDEDFREAWFASGSAWCAAITSWKLSAAF